ncbi:MAG TPA: VOC family protein [Candidatus Methanoperedens sp.]
MNRVSHFHIPVDDMERAKKFYSTIFGWNVKESDKYYRMVTTTPIDKSGRPKEAGGINGALFERKVPEDTVSIVIRVPSIEDYLEKIEEAGGKIITGKTPAEGIGFHAEFRDTENNVIGLWEEKLKKN